MGGNTSKDKNEGDEEADGYAIIKPDEINIHSIAPIEVFDGIYLGSMSTARDNALLEAYSITHILNMNDYEGEEDVYRPKDYEYLILNISDLNDLKRHFHGASHFIDEGRRYGNVLVHCVQPGGTLSIAAVISYLLTFEEMSMTSIQSDMRDRPFPLPSPFIQELVEYEEALIAKSKRIMQDRQPAPLRPEELHSTHFRFDSDTGGFTMSAPPPSKRDTPLTEVRCSLNCLLLSSGGNTLEEGDRPPSVSAAKKWHAFDYWSRNKARGAGSDWLLADGLPERIRLPLNGTQYVDAARSPTEGLSRSGVCGGAFLARVPDGQWMDGNISLTNFRDSERERARARASERERGRHPMEESSSTSYNPANAEGVSQRGSHVSTDVAYLAPHRRTPPTDVAYLAGVTGFTGFTTGKLTREPGVLKLDFC